MSLAFFHRISLALFYIDIFNLIATLAVDLVASVIPKVMMTIY